MTYAKGLTRRQGVGGVILRCVSKAFTRDDEGAGDAPQVMPRRAPLPVGMPNYVTRRGLERLRNELAGVQASRPAQDGSEAERARELSLQAARVAEIAQRIATSVLVEPDQQPKDEVRFGAKVRVRNTAGVERSYQIVGVDEADAARSAIAFVAPLARALLGKRVGDVANVRTPSGEDELEILDIDYE
jgi:transcription elongation factor GreB